MREINRIIPLKVNEETMHFRLTKLDAFSGGKLLKMLNGVQRDREEAFGLSDFLFSLGDYDFESVMRVCLAHAEAELPAGFMTVWKDGCCGVPEMETETMACLKLTLEVMAFSMEGFFTGGGSGSGSGKADSCPQSR